MRTADEKQIWIGALVPATYSYALGNPSEACSIINEARTDILAKDWELTVNQTNTHTTLIRTEQQMKLHQVGMLYEYGTRGTKLMQHRFSALSKLVFGDRTCAHCKDSIPTWKSYPQHLVSQHFTDFDLNTIKNWLENKDFKNPYSNWLMLFPPFSFTIPIVLSPLLHFFNIINSVFFLSQFVGGCTCTILYMYTVILKGALNELWLHFEIASTHNKP